MNATQYLSSGKLGKKLDVVFTPVKGSPVIRGNYSVEWRGDKQFGPMTAPVDGHSCLNDLPIAIIVHHKRGGWLCRTGTPGRYWLVTPHQGNEYTAREVLLHV